MDGANKEGQVPQEAKVAVPNEWFKPFVKATDIKSRIEKGLPEEKRISWRFKDGDNQYPFLISLVSVSPHRLNSDVPAELLDRDEFMNMPGILDWQRKNGSTLFTPHIEVGKSEGVSYFPYEVVMRSPHKEEVKSGFSKDRVEPYRATQYTWKDSHGNPIVPLLALGDDIRLSQVEMMLRSQTLTQMRRTV